MLTYITQLKSVHYCVCYRVLKNRYARKINMKKNHIFLLGDFNKIYLPKNRHHYITNKILRTYEIKTIFSHRQLI